MEGGLLRECACIIQPMSKDELKDTFLGIRALFFKHLFGEQTERVREIYFFIISNTMQTTEGYRWSAPLSRCRCTATC